MPDLTAQLPSALQKNTQRRRLGTHETPSLVVHPDRDSGEKAPLILWMHGRTVSKELDPGRYLRWMRAGLGTCAVDLPGHGERAENRLQRAENTLEVVRQMVAEIDAVIEALRDMEVFDMNKLAIGGMSAGGMAALVRLCRQHPFKCSSVESTIGSWRWQSHREMFVSELAAAMNPIDHLDQWREIPLQAIHSRGDEWVAIEGQIEFLDALRAHYNNPDSVELIAYEHTGAPHEHAGFGTLAADAKERQRDFFLQYLSGKS